MTPSTENHSIVYVRVSPEEKAMLRVLADSEFDGSMATAIRYLIQMYADGRQRPKVRLFCSDVLTMKEAQQYLKISHQKLYDLINEGELQTYTVDRRRFTTVAAIEDFVKTRLARTDD